LPKQQSVIKYDKCVVKYEFVPFACQCAFLSKSLSATQ